MKTLLVLTPGAFTSVQDVGRYGYQHLGVPVSGAMDRFACRVANLLVGNSPDRAVLEMTVVGPRLAVLVDADVALTGADMSATLNDRPVPLWSSFRVTPGDVLAFYQVKKGCRAYLAITGGLEVPLVMGSRSTYLGGCLGGYHGRVLQKGDFLDRGHKPLQPAPLTLPQDQRPVYADQLVLRAVPGPQRCHFADSATLFFQASFSVTDRANRMGYRLSGPFIAMAEGMPKSIISEPIIAGAVQVPEDGQPIILMGEQTVGGYAKIATVIAADLDKVAQAIPGDRIRFESVTVEQAHQIYREAEQRLNALQKWVSRQD